MSLARRLIAAGFSDLDKGERFLAAPELATLPNVVALMWGAEDLVASLGGTSSRFPSGARAGQYLLDQGYTSVVNLEGGTLAWAGAGLPTEGGNA